MHYYRRLLAAHVCFIVSSAVLFGEDSHGRRRVQLPLNGSAIGRSFEGAVSTSLDVGSMRQVPANSVSTNSIEGREDRFPSKLDTSRSVVAVRSEHWNRPLPQSADEMAPSKTGLVSQKTSAQGAIPIPTRATDRFEGQNIREQERSSDLRIKTDTSKRAAEIKPQSR